MNALKKNSQAKFKKTFKEKLKHLLNIWLSQHVRAFNLSLNQYVNHPISNLLTISVISISLALSASFYLLIENIQTASYKWKDSLQITVFLKDEVSEKQAQILAKKISANNKVNTTYVISKDKALTQYQKLSGFSEAIKIFDENPFPNVIVIKLKLDSFSETSTQSLIKKLTSFKDADNIQYDSQWVKRLFALLDVIYRIIFIFSCLLSVAVLLIINNTIRLAIYKQHQEIEITKLFGATNAFIRRPFLYGGFLYGIFGGILACIFVDIFMQLLQNPVDKFAKLYESNFELAELTFIHILTLLGTGIFLGLFGSWISVRYHLKKIEPQ